MVAVKPGDRKRGSLPTLPRWCILLILLIWLLGGFVWHQMGRYLVDIPEQKAILQTLQSRADLYRRQIDQQIGEIIEKVESLAADPDTLDVLLRGDELVSKWQKRARTLRNVDPQTEWLSRAKAGLRKAERLYLLDAGDAESPLPGNYVATLMLEAALAGEKPAPRAAKTDQWNIYVARPVFDQSQVVGVLLVEYLPGIFRSSIAGSVDKPGRVSLIQSVPGFDDVTVFFEGSGWKNEYSVTVPSSVENWKIRFTGSKSLVENSRPTHWLYYGSVLLLIALVITATVAIVRKYMVFPDTPARKAPRIDPRDNLFAEKHVRHAHTKDPPARASAPDGAGDKTPTQATAESFPLPAHVFRDYDIRGRADEEITRKFARELGRTLGTMMLQRGEHTLAICADGRLSSPKLKSALEAGILSTGCDLLDIGEAPTPVLNFALSTLEECSSGVMVTASHNPKEDNGFKIIVDNQPLSSEQIQNLRHDMAGGEFIESEGDRREMSLTSRYIERVVEDVVPPIAMAVAIDCGNGISSLVAPALFRALGARVTGLYTDVDGNFPNHDPDPTVSANLQDLIRTVTGEGLDLGLAFDGDGDRFVAVTGSGRIVWPDELMMIFAKDIVSRNPGADIVYDVKSTRRLSDLISSYGGRPVMWKTGHAHMRNKVRDARAPLGGEFSGHIFFNDRWFGFDDGLYAAARLLEILSIREQSLDDIVAAFPDAFATEEIRIPIAEERKKTFIQEFLRSSDFDEAQIVTIDGVRVEFDVGWGLIRASNTSAALTLRFEADTEDSLLEIIDLFADQLERQDHNAAAVLQEYVERARSG